ncbi:MAG: RidA family protein [Syntrophobacteraceae bacterium]
MVLEAIQTDKAPAAIGPYSQAIRARGFLFVSGQLPIDPRSGEMAGPDFAAQARQCLENLKQILLAAGCNLEQVVSVDVFITEMSRFSEFNGVYETFFTGHKPARAVVEVSALPRGAMVEVKCIAASD